MAEIIHGSSSRPIIFLGDLNADPDNKKSTGGKALKILDVTDKWFIPRPEGEWSYISSDGKRSSRIDHAICSTSLDNVMAKYVYKINSITLAGPKVTGPISDHAALMVLIN